MLYKNKSYLKNKSAGFTVVELVIVIVVIAILAALATVSYSSITKEAGIRAIQSNLESTVSQLRASKHQNGGSYPSSLANMGGGLSASTDLGQYYYATNGTAFCLSLTSNKSYGTYYYSTNTNRVQSGSAVGACRTIVSTFVGKDATPGYVDGVGSAARFGFTAGLGIDTAGNVYLAEQGNHRIRKITPDGVVTTLAGSGTAGLVNNTGTAAQFKTPYGVATDAAGNVYVADTGNYAIRKITPAGVVTTLAGSGTMGASDGTGTAASFRTPYDLIVDSFGNVFVTDSCTIRKITPAGVVTTVAGQFFNYGTTNGTGTAARFADLIYGITIDSNNNLYIADTNNNLIRKMTPAGVVTTVAGNATAGYADGTGSAAQFKVMNGLTSDGAGNLYVADRSNRRIRAVSQLGAVTTYAGTGAGYGVDGDALTVATFASPSGIVLNRNTGVVYVADSQSYTIRKIEPGF